jgi:hypothetical protein
MQRLAKLKISSSLSLQGNSELEPPPPPDCVMLVAPLMPGKYKFVFGLANDEIGYIIPKSQWDMKAPYTYGRKDSPYGEENSLGPETASILHKNLQEILGELAGK